MQRSQLEHLIRAAAEVTNQYEFVIIGSQSILGTFAAPPPECTVSMEADIYPLQDKVFNRALLAHGAVSMADALARTRDLEDPAEAARVEGWIRRLGTAL